MEEVDLEEWEEMIEMTKNNIERSYCPYSGFPVSTCIELRNGKKFCGVNVENGSYGGTICAERASVVKMVSETLEGERLINRIFLYCPKSVKVSMPCGICRQILSEFSMDETRVLCMNSLNDYKYMRMMDLFPFGFSLKKK